MSTKRKRADDSKDDDPLGSGSNGGKEDLSKSWREVLGNPPPRSRVRDWIAFQKKKWEWQARQKAESKKRLKKGSQKIKALP